MTRFFWRRSGRENNAAEGGAIAIIALLLLSLASTAIVVLSVDSSDSPAKGAAPSINASDVTPFLNETPPDPAASQQASPSTKQPTPSELASGVPGTESTQS